MNKETTSPAIPSIGKVVKLAKINEINRDLLRVHLEKIKMQIANFNNPYKTSKSVYAQTEKVGNFVELNV